MKIASRDTSDSSMTGSFSIQQDITTLLISVLLSVKPAFKKLTLDL
jgi:hypothetical protein